jgi:hypothetical protein
MKFPFTKSFYALSKKAAEDYLLQQNNATQKRSSYAPLLCLALLTPNPALAGLS